MAVAGPHEAVNVENGLKIESTLIVCHEYHWNSL